MREVILEMSKTRVVGVSLAAAQVKPGGASSHGNRPRARSVPSTDINVTPLIDVVLVLLIIFMVLTPLAEKQMFLRVPEYEPANCSWSPPDQVPPDQTVLTVKTDGRVLLNRQRRRSTRRCSL